MPRRRQGKSVLHRVKAQTVSGNITITPAGRARRPPDPQHGGGRLHHVEPAGAEVVQQPRDQRAGRATAGWRGAARRRRRGRRAGRRSPAARTHRRAAGGPPHRVDELGVAGGGELAVGVLHHRDPGHPNDAAASARPASTSSVTRAPAFRRILASPGSRPNTASGSMRESMQVTTASPSGPRPRSALFARPRRVAGVGREQIVEGTVQGGHPSRSERAVQSRRRSVTTEVMATKWQATAATTARATPRGTRRSSGTDRASV